MPDCRVQKCPSDRATSINFEVLKVLRKHLSHSTSLIIIIVVITDSVCVRTPMLQYCSETA